jgi:uncharacterized phiE125 gp8 family phage protein
MSIKLNHKQLMAVSVPVAFVTLAEAKSHLRVDFDDDDTLITGLIAAACSTLEGSGGLCGYSISETDYQLKLYPPYHTHHCALKIPVPYIKEITEVKYFDTSNNEITANLNDWTFMADRFEGFLYPKIESWMGFYSRWDAMTVKFTAGIPNLPPEVKHAALLLISAYYDNRGSEEMTIPKAVYSLIGLKRMGGIG